VIKDGRFGPYVTDGTTNASLRTADDPATISVERASDLLSERRSKEALEGPAPKKTTKRVVKKTTAKKTAAKKTAAKKTTAKKTAAAGTR
jgi:DNA topoisomerase-1